MALQRDALAASGPRINEAQICSLADHQVSSLENLVTQQRKAQIRIAKVLKEAETRHKHVRWIMYLYISLASMKSDGKS